VGGKEVIMQKENVAYEKAYQFAIQIVKVYQYLLKEKKEYVLAKQLLRSGTSIGANLSEANGAISRADFSNKVSLAYKECLETKYWLSLLKDSSIINIENYNSIYPEADEIGRILFAILRTTRIKNK
jgi:four helix bundle protein